MTGFVARTKRSAGYVVPATEYNQQIDNENYLLGMVAAEFYIPATSFRPQASNGCAGLQFLSLATNKQDVGVLYFDKDAVEYAQTPFFGMPSDYDGGTITYEIDWNHLATTTNFKCAWQVELVMYADDQALDTAWGTAVQTNDTGGTTSDHYTTPTSGAVTPGGTAAAGAKVKIRVSRVATDGTNDTLAVDAGFEGIKIHYTRA